MEQSGELTFSLSPLALDEGGDEEKAAFGVVEITANGRLLSSGLTLEANELQSGSCVSGYHLAEWLVWNWWRLRWEPSASNSSDVLHWDFAHCMSCIGEGYVWPNVEIASDGHLIRLTALPSTDPNAETFRYVGGPAHELITTEAFENAIHKWVGYVLNRLEEANIRGTNLHRLQDDLERERNREHTSKYRRIEAMLGHDPDGADESVVKAYLGDANSLGQAAVDELAAEAGRHPAGAMQAPVLTRCAKESGFDASASDFARLDPAEYLPAWGEVEAWRVGTAMAQALRQGEVLDGQPVNNAKLAALIGTNEEAINNLDRLADCISFVLNSGAGGPRIALRSKWETGRRFDLARLLAERLSPDGASEALHPATQSYTYRQKVQRAFAAEFLAPIEAVDALLDGDTSEEKQNDVAEHFQVSPLTIRSLLVNNHRIGRDGSLDFLDRL